MKFSTPGPWDDEPDEVAFTHEGLACRISRHTRYGHLCGYVAVEPGHVLYGRSYSDEIDRSLAESWRQRKADDRAPWLAAFINSLGDQSRISLDCAIDVHGGLTWSGDRHPLGDKDGKWWFGFDASHASDLSPGMDFRIDRAAKYRDLAYVRREVEGLAAQLAAWTIPTLPEVPA